MQVQDWGEEGIIHYLSHCFSAKNGIVGIGDDCAVIPAENEEAWLVTTDALIEGVHFLKDQIAPIDLGYKTIAVNVSDVAAMGGTPKFAFLTLALPSTVHCEWTRLVLQGIKEACEKWHIQLLGGDTVGSRRDIFINLTLIGSAPQKHIRYRNQAQLGDRICVSGNLGNSGGGLQALKEKIQTTPEVKILLEAHFRPTPHIQQGRWLASQPGVHAMMDVSDGLDLDLKRLIKSSHKGAHVDISKIPLSEELLKMAQTKGWNPLQLALTGGEDYCLLITIDQKKQGVIQDFFKKFGAPLYEIGQITDQVNELTYYDHGEKKEIDFPPFDHFHKSS
ncbi:MULTISPECIES: thiamine-phosphate kinase [Parachlamydia]|uniref:Thiamine-monophosphate kinase n=2 Tax=Parachlamydia acanthamoebae TaxID=83552 RepID=F8L2B5_PARAV|nr:thiamine-phosphate kinase [Parachlamydia acanthamoebae]CCB87428.1 thiamine-monophosphate kinase [Parachlamydia acanthamoebae UV-7]